MKLRSLLFLAPLFLFFACAGNGTHAARSDVDSLCERAASWLYRDVDSLRSLASEALAQARSAHYADGEGEALNLLMGERFQQMDFDSVLLLAAQVGAATHDPVELLAADVMQMRVAQRTSDNRSFFVHRSHALRRIGELEGREDDLTPHRRRRLATARADLHITASTYFYYVDQQERALDEIRQAEPFCRLPEDTASWLYYCYMRGSGGLADAVDSKGIACEEFDYLFKCYTFSKNRGYRFFTANALQSLATLCADSLRWAAVEAYKPDALTYLSGIFGTDSMALAMAQNALQLFVDYDDLYQEACVLRTLGELSFAEGRADVAIDYYASALDCVNFHHQCYYAAHEVLSPGEENDLLQPYVADAPPLSVERRWMQTPEVRTVPEWIAGIRQQLSVAFSALGMKSESDYNRNIYLDLLDVTREDAELSNRYDELRASSRRLRWMLAGVAAMVVACGVLTLFLIRAWRRRAAQRMRLLRLSFQRSADDALRAEQQLEEEQEQLREQQAAAQLRLERDKQHHVETRAKLQLVRSITPFLDCIIHEVRRMQRSGKPDEASLRYIGELTEHINHLNELLTSWIQMSQGQLSLQLTTFELEPLLAILRGGHFAYDQKNLRLDIPPTTLAVKADRALTLFMLNTFADNARKFTPSGGTVSITAASGGDGTYVELSVSDTGCGIAQDDIDLILNHKVYDATLIGNHGNPAESGQQTRRVGAGTPQSPDGNPAGFPAEGSKGFGFGLLNCKGIIEKYRKTNPLFSVCQMGIESRVGEGSRFWFRLPRVALALLMALVLLPAGSVRAAGVNAGSRALDCADSVYYCNLSGRYDRALTFADSALAALTADHRRLTADTASLSLRPRTATPAEWQWWQRGDTLDYGLLLGLRNEVAVAALALNDWPLYRYNNRIYARLYKLLNQDASLEAYCLQTERAQFHQRMAIFLLVLLAVAGMLASWFFYFRPQMRYRRAVADLRTRHHALLMQQREAARQHRQNAVELAGDEYRRRLYEEERLHVQNQILDNCLSTIKHETMYYPGRIGQLIAQLEGAPTTDAPAAQAGDRLQALAETVDYYKEVFTLLSAQADHQSEALGFRRHLLRPADVMEGLEAYCRRRARRLGREGADLHTADLSGGAPFLGDGDLVRLLLRQLLDAELAMPACGAMRLTAQADERFVRFTLEAPSTSLSASELHDFFMPHEGAFPQLIARQVIREHDTFLGHPGCRIEAEARDGGHVLWCTLPRNS